MSEKDRFTGNSAYIPTGHSPSGKQPEHEPHAHEPHAHELHTTEVYASEGYDAYDGQEAREAAGEMAAQGKKNDPPHRWRKNIITGTVVAAVIVIALFVLPIPFGTIAISGNAGLTEGDIIAAGDIRRPVNILQINSSRLEERLTRDLRVQSAQVRYIFPLTLQVEVTARQPVAVASSQFGYISLDRNGQVIKQGTAIEDTEVPIISGVKLSNVLLGDTVDSPNIKAALDYLKALSPAGLKDISEINVGDPNMLIAYTVSGLPIHLGTAEDLPEKARLTEEMLRDMRAGNVDAQFIDVNIKSPYIKAR